MIEPIDHQEEFIDRKRPNMLTVLCILTFVVSAYYIFSGIISLFFRHSFDPGQWDQVSQQVGEALENADQSSAKMMETVMTAMSETISNAIQYAVTLGIVEIVVALLSAYAAYLMWKLRKSGFWIYTAAKIVGLVVPLVLLGINIITIAATVFAIVIGLIFVVLYAVNRKYMV